MKATPFSRVLVANRGEIALRVMRSARRMGLGTVAVYSSADAEAPHVRAADQAVAIGAALPSESYLSIPALREAARKSRADAVHPGYGFLAESAEFARACRDAGLVFIGPSPEAISAMGDKAGAKRLMQAASVPCVPGWDGAADDAELAEHAAAIGYPVMIKARAGGGGRGMRLVHRPAGFAEALRSARSEAQAAFGDAAVILERALTAARHIEVQVFADRHGNVVHLGERDCSVQRRHQKLIEEAPSPAVDATLRERLATSALAAVRAVDYEGAGTVEFLLDRDGRHYFIEMNTRLQVEHPVTEAITGLDMVEWQFRVAAGEPLPLTQDQVRFDGHAIEVRLCAEDAAHGFMPASGTLACWQPPPGLRVEHALHSGMPIVPFYDSMIAKLVAHGRDRDEARRRLAAGLEALVALGVPTNRRFLSRCLVDPVFVAGEATTAFIGERSDALADPPGDGAHPLAALAALVLFQCAPHHVDDRGGEVIAPPLAHRLPVPMRLQIGSTAIAVRVQRTGARRVDVALASDSATFELLEQRPNFLRFIRDGVADAIDFVRDADGAWLQHQGIDLRVEDRTRAPPVRARDASGNGTLRASMNGRVVAVAVRVGDRVDAGAALVTLEAMKMEHVHVAPRAGVVRAVGVKVGQQVAAGSVVVELGVEPSDGQAVETGVDSVALQRGAEPPEVDVSARAAP
ncbi:MAG: biotin carboxylase N-terminal domain-containing protein [Caldimonas sp.]